ncbi:MAG: hypothetical protein GDA50_07995 [Alphaproteobacteria bacterium GM202ARS2]|nr:hypothetical protein [Alphaproteobacteria bacterium GM202ARS2]
MSPPITGPTTNNPFLTRGADATERRTFDSRTTSRDAQPTQRKARALETRANNSILDKKVLSQLNKDKEVYVTRTGYLAHKENHQVGGRIGKLLGFRVKTVYVDLYHDNARVKSADVLDASASRKAITTFLEEHIKQSLQYLQPASTYDSGQRVRNNHVSNERSQALYHQVDELKDASLQLNKSEQGFNDKRIERSVSFIKEGLASYDNYQQPKHHDYRDQQQKSTWQSIKNFVRSLRSSNP